MSTFQHTQFPFAGQRKSYELQPQQASPELQTHQPFRFTPRREFQAWASTLWSLVLHCIVSMAILIFVTCYVNDRHFNPTERKPWVPLADETRTQLNQYKPLQSDITTLLSSALVVLRLIATAWASSPCWRSAFFLMERPGLRRRDLDLMVSFGLFTPSAYSRDIRVVYLGAILLATLSAQAVSPILTGSIAWIPSNRLATLQSDASVIVPMAENLILWSNYTKDVRIREAIVRNGVGYVSIAWGRSVDRNVMKRVIMSTTGLNINTTIANVTLPYFSVTSLEWISDPLNTLSPDQLDIQRIRVSLPAYGAFTPLQLAVGVFIPDAPFNHTSAPVPSPSIVSETRTLIMQTQKIPINGSCSNDSVPFGRLPPTMGHFLYAGRWCYAFARVTFSAGAAVCATCRISSASTIQNDTSLLLQEDIMTTEALRLMADLSVVLVQMNSSIPSTTGDVDDYVIGLLSRSYLGAWSALTFSFGDPRTPPSRYTPSLSSLQAQVDLKRVYVWFGIHLLATLSGAIFLLMQSTSECRLLGGTTLAAFELDATEATTINGCEQLKTGGLLKLKPNDGRLRIVVRTSESDVDNTSMKGGF